MQELIRFQSTDFELTIWCPDVGRRRKTYRQTLRKRGCSERDTFPLITSIPSSGLSVSIPVGCTPSFQGNTTVFKLTEPLFFENSQYHFEWIFTNKDVGVVSAEILHRSRKVVDAFRFAGARDSIPARLSGAVSTANDIGWMTLKVSFRTTSNVLKTETFALEVLPSKMDLDSDLPVMYRAVDNSFPLWRFKLSETTELSVSRGMERGDFELMWLANFSALRQKFEAALKVIENAPHTRLQPEPRKVRAGGLKGRVKDRVGMRVREDLFAGRVDRKYTVDRKRLSSDTAENRFVKMAVEYCGRRLVQLESRLRRENEIPDRQKLSDSFFDELISWRRPLQSFLRNGFITEVGRFEGLSGQETALQRKTGYSSLYRCWQELRYYLDAFADESRISLKSVAEIYEVWCFLEIRSILTDELGFVETTARRGTLEKGDFFEFRLQDGFRGAFQFERDDGVIARLAHEPRFRKDGRDIKSYLVTQKPDILLEIVLPGDSDTRFFWLFDAKYRVSVTSETEGSHEDESVDNVPDDALNQMHRYRDALIRTVEAGDALHRKSRPVVGAFALYPGYFNQTTESNPYEVPVREVGIGAFALLPSNSGAAGRHWLTEFLKSEIGENAGTYHFAGSHGGQDDLFVREAARIPYEGMRQVLYPDLVMTAVVAGGRGRNDEYLKRFADGSAAWYHVPQAQFRVKNFGYHLANEIRYFGLGVNSFVHPGTKSIERLWPVESASLVRRREITAEQAGSTKNSDDMYYIFKLGKPLTLKEPVTHVPNRPFKNSLKLTTLNRIQLVEKFSDIIDVYREMLA